MEGWIAFGWVVAIAVTAAAYCGACVGNQTGFSWLACRCLRVPTIATFIASRENVWRRSPRRPMEALEFVDKIIDRQINKIIGLLTLDGIFLVAVQAYLEHHDKGPLAKLFGNYSAACLWISVTLSLRILMMDWGGAAHEAIIRQAFEGTAKAIRERTIVIQIVGYLTVAAVFLIAVPLIFSEAPNVVRPPPPQPIKNIFKFSLTLNVPKPAERKEPITVPALGTIALDCGTDLQPMFVGPFVDPANDPKNALSLAPANSSGQNMDFAAAATALSIRRDGRDLVALILIGSVDNRALTPELKRYYGSNAGLGQARARFVKEQLLTKLPEIHLAPPDAILTLNSGPNAIGPNVDRKHRESDRRVEICALWQREVTVLAPPP